jgi:phosphoglycerate dehydrogenase-like enzyme
MKFLVPYDFSFQKYYDTDAPLPYEATGQKLADEIAAQDQSITLLLPQSEAEMLDMAPEADALVAYSLTNRLFNAAGKLRWVQAGSAGIDHFFKSSEPSLEDLAARGIVLTKAAGVTRIIIGEHVFAMILAMSRNVPRAVRQQDRREWTIFMGSELMGSTLGVVGLGEIGERVAELGRAFGMHVVGSRRSIAGYSGHAHEVFGADRVDEVLRRADYLVLACALNESTRGLINARALRLMKPGAVLINVARGEIVVESDLVDALKSGQLAGAALDTFGKPGRGELRNLEELDRNSPLWGLPNVLIMPNNASATPKIYEYLARIIVENCRRFRSNLPLKYIV